MRPRKKTDKVNNNGPTPIAWIILSLLGLRLKLVGQLHHPMSHSMTRVASLTPVKIGYLVLSSSP